MLQAAERLDRALPRPGGGGGPRLQQGGDDQRLQLLLATPPALRSLAESTLGAHPSLPRVAVLDSAERFDAYGAAHLALACSGTVNMELALAGTPQLALYRTSWLTAFYIRAVLQPVVRHATLPNILAEREVIPELLFERCAPGPIAAAAMRLLADPSLREVQCAALRELLPQFGVYEDGELVPPSRVAARALLRHLT